MSVFMRVLGVLQGRLAMSLFTRGVREPQNRSLRLVRKPLGRTPRGYAAGQAQGTDLERRRA